MTRAARARILAAAAALAVYAGCGADDLDPPDPTWTAPRPHAADPTDGLDHAIATTRTTIARAARSRPRPAAKPARVAPAGTGYSGALPPRSVLMCESKGNYQAENPRSSASGGWQIIDGTWNRYKGYARAKDAPPHVQDEKATQLWAGGKGWRHWKACL